MQGKQRCGQSSPSAGEQTGWSWNPAHCLPSLEQGSGPGAASRLSLCLLARCLPDLEVRQEPLDFSDVPAWAAGEIDRLSAAGLVLGYGDGRLGADDPLTVEQVGLLVGRVGAAVPDTV